MSNAVRKGIDMIDASIVLTSDLKFEDSQHIVQTTVGAGCMYTGGSSYTEHSIKLAAEHRMCLSHIAAFSKQLRARLSASLV